MLNTVESILVMIDFQKKLTDIVHRTELVLPNALAMVMGCQVLEIPILPTVQAPEKLGLMMPALSEALAGIEPIAKSSFSALRNSDFLVALEESSRRQVILMGVETHVCILQTGLDLLGAGYEVHVMSDGVFSCTTENHSIALQRLHDSGATISSIEMALFEMIRTSKHPQFRTISKLVKSSRTSSNIS